MRMTRRLAAISLAAALALTAAAPLGRAVAGTPDDMLVIASHIDDLASLDPQESFEYSGGNISNNLYLNLVSFDPTDLTKGYQPAIAESWEVSGDGRVFTFRIRPGMKFASGNPITARDVEFSLQRAVAMAKTPAFILTQFGFTPDNMAQTLRALDDMTFRLTTDRKYATSMVLNCLTATIGSIVDSALVKSHEADGDWGNGWLRVNSAGAGAYTLVNWKANESYTLAANPNFWLGAPAMKRVIVRHIAESATQRLLLEKGDIDIARNLSPEDIAAIEGNPDLAVDSDLRGRFLYLGFNQANPILSHPKVVEALKYLIDYDGMTGTILKGQYVTHQAYVPLTYLGELRDNPYRLDVAKAKALLAEAGYPDGFDIQMNVRAVQDRLEVAQSVQGTFAQAGVNVTINQGTGKQMLAAYRARNFEIVLEGWGTDYPDPNTNASTFASNPDNRAEAKLAGKLAWRLAWDDPEITAATAAAAQEGDTEKRRQMYVDTQRLFQARAPFIVMFQKIEEVGRRANVHGFVTGAAVTAAFYWTVTK